MQQAKDLKCLDGLIAEFGGSHNAGGRSNGVHGLLLEHLQAARRDLLGSMRGEYRSSLQFAKESASAIVDKGVRDATRKTLQDLLTPRSSTLLPAS
jgi:hypothetical protein